MTSSNGKVHSADWLPEMPKIWTPDELLATEFADPRWAVPGLIPEGLTILAGNPKQGKSWLCYNLTLAIALGGIALGSIPVEAGEVLYLSLEDTPRRLKNRLKKLTNGWAPFTAPTAQIVTTWPRMGRGGLKLLAHYLSNHPKCRLVIIDTLAKIRNEASSSRNQYDEDYRTASALKQVADEFGIAMIVVHHLRKMQSEDIYERVSGSNGLTGAADGVAIIKRERGKADAVLFISGRDVEEQELAVKFDPSNATWTLIGDAATFRLSAERQKIVKLLTDTDRAMTPRDLAGLIGNGAKEVNVKRLCYDMSTDGQIKNAGDGRFSAIPKGVHVTASGRPADENPVTTGHPVTQTNGRVTGVSLSNQVTTVTGSDRVPPFGEPDEFPTECVDCGERLPDGWKFHCPSCLAAMEERIDPD